MKLVNVLVSLVLSMLSRLALFINGQSVQAVVLRPTPAGPIQVQALAPVDGPAKMENLTPAEQLMYSLGSMTVNRQRIEPVQSAQAAKDALEAAASRRARRALRRQALTTA